MKAEIAVLGAGVVGASIAYHLAEAGQRDVLLIERGQIGQASTAQSVGGVRSLFRHRLDIEMSRYSRAAYQQIADATSVNLTFRQVGYLMIGRTEERARTLSQMADEAEAVGVPVERLLPDAVRERVPGLDVSDATCAILSPSDGYFTEPRLLAVAYAQRAQALGVTVMENAPVQAVTRQGAAFSLTLAGQVITAKQIVIALNAFASPILQSLGVSLASYPYPRHVFELTPPPAPLSATMPLTIFSDDDLMFRHDGNRLLCICGTPETSTQALDFDAARLPGIAERMGKRVETGAVSLRHAWSGLRAMTLDRQPLIGRVPDVDGAWCAIGFSGHGIMHAPAVGLALTQTILGDSTAYFDLQPFDPRRAANPQHPPPVLEVTHG